MVDDFPLLELFTQLRSAGLPLGIDDYQAVLKAMQSGYGIADREALKRLCKTLWVRSQDEQCQFDYYFEQFMVSAIPQSTPKKRNWIVISVIAPILIAGIGLTYWFNRPKPEVIPSAPTPALQTPGMPLPEAAPTPPSEARSQNWDWLILLALVSGVNFGMVWAWMRYRKRQPQSKLHVQAAPKALHEIKDEMQLVQTVHTPDQRKLTSLYVDFLPVTQRQMKQSWRYLRRMVREGLPSELDIDATVQQIARSGVLLEPVLVAPRVNCTELILLIDQEGSMVAFRSLSERLIETALRGGKLAKTGVYYFHNCGVNFLYRDPAHVNAEPIQAVMRQWKYDRTVVLIFSDAGAARGGLNLKRLEATQAFLMQLKLHVRQVAWLNPIPKQRWRGTSAEEIARLVPMFEGTRNGLDAAIGALRGRHSVMCDFQGEQDR